MRTMTINSSRCTDSFSVKHPPTAEVESGDIIAFETSCACYERLAAGILEDEFDVNLVTGPVAVKGAKPGDALRVDILDIEIRRAWAVRMPFLSSGSGQFSFHARELELRENRVGISTAWVAVDPMVGCIGVAPKKGHGSTLAPVGRWGGNMDLRELRQGASILLPVFHRGGLLSLGDLHAAMGQGEPLLAGIEASGVVTVRISVLPDSDITCPRLLVPGATICIGMGNKGKGDTLEQARRDAVSQGLQLLERSHDLKEWDAWIYAASQLELSFGGPASSIVLCRVPDICIEH